MADIGEGEVLDRNAVINTLLQVSADLQLCCVELAATRKDIKANTAAMERSALHFVRIANNGEGLAKSSINIEALVETEVRASKLAGERAAETLDKIPVALAVLATWVQASVSQSTEAKTEAKRAADNSRSFQLEPNAPRHPHHDEDSGKTTAGAARRAWRDFLRAPPRSQVAALALVAFIGLAVLGYLAIKNGYRAQQLEHEGAVIHQKEK